LGGCRGGLVTPKRVGGGTNEEKQVVKNGKRQWPVCSAPTPAADGGARGTGFQVRVGKKWRGDIEEKGGRHGSREVWKFGVEWAACEEAAHACDL